MSMTVQKWGNSHAVRIPSSLAKQMGLVYGTEIEVKSANGGTLR